MSADGEPGTGIEIGQDVGGYRIAGRLGRGGMGEVYKAWDQRLDRSVALKILTGDLARDPDRLQRFTREAKALAALSHPSIVTVFSVEIEVPIPFLTMELVDGKTLSRSIPTGGMPLERFFTLAVAVADGLAAAHDQGIVHRDLKPANIMIDRAGRPRILDFGLARTPSRGPGQPGLSATVSLQTEPGVVLGTVGYMSPEQVRGELVDARSDVFSLGLILYEMATGRRAFEATTGPELLSAVLRDTPTPVEELRSEAPHHLDRIVRHCLEKDPDRRYQSAKDVRNELADLQRELETRALLESQPAAPIRQETKAHTRLVVGAIVVFILSLVVAFGLVRRGVDGPAGAGIPEIRSLAVLPFDNLMRDPEQAYFVEGMHEALITDLAKIGALRVISRTSTMRYADTDKSLPEIADELDVDALIEGSVLRADGQVRITAQLIEGATDQHLWAQSYDRELENVLGLLSEVATAIASEIEVAMTPGQRQRLATTKAVDPEAYELYLKGRHFFNQGLIDGFRQALGYLERAVELDPDFADGWAMLSGSYMTHGFFSLQPPEQVIPEARRAAARALELDRDSAGAHATLGLIALYFDWDWPTAQRELERALEIDPTATMTYHGYADYLAVMGDCEGSVQQTLEGRRHDPMGVWANMFVVGHLVACHRYEEAIEEGRGALDAGVGGNIIRLYMGHALWFLGRHEEAIEEWRIGRGAESPSVQALEGGYAEGGPREAMLAVGDWLVAASANRPVDPFDVATYYAVADERDPAFEWLEKAYEQRVPLLLHLTFNPYFDPIRDDPRFEDLLRRIGIPE